MSCTSYSLFYYSDFFLEKNGNMWKVWNALNVW